MQPHGQGAGVVARGHGPGVSIGRQQRGITMKRFSDNDYVEVTVEGDLKGRKGVVVRLRMNDNGAWVDMDDPLPIDLTSFPQEDSRHRHILLYPTECQLAADICPPIRDKEKEADYYRCSYTQHKNGTWQKPDWLPSKVFLAKVVTGDGPFAHVKVAPGVHDCECNQNGAVSVKARDGSMLGLRLDEFTPRN